MRGQALLEDHMKKYGFPPDAYAVLAYTAVDVLLQGVEKAGSVDSKKIGQMLGTQSFNTVKGDAKFREDHQLEGKYLAFFVKGKPYKLFGLIPGDIHLYGVDEPGTAFFLGTDRNGRDMFSRIVIGGRVSMTVGLVGVILTLIFGSVLGTASGYFGGIFDTVLQRGIEILMSFPTIALWAAFAAALPPDITAITRFFFISIISVSFSFCTDAHDCITSSQSLRILHSRMYLSLLSRVRVATFLLLVIGVGS